MTKTTVEDYFYLVRGSGLCKDTGIFQQLFFLELLLLSEEFGFEIYQLHQQQNNTKIKDHRHQLLQ